MKKYRILSISALVLGILALSGAIFGPVSAEEETEKPAVWLQVSPTSQSMTLNPGDKYDGTFKVSNIGSEGFTFKVYASPFSVVGENYDHDYLSEKNYNQIHRWITFDESSYTLTVDGTQEITYHINVPEDVPAGSQHAVLFAESSGGDSSTATTGSGIKAISRVGMRIAANISGETNENVEITDYALPTLYLAFGSSQITATSKVKNTGNVDVQASYVFEVKPFFGGDPVASETKTTLLYPDSEFRHDYIWDKTPLLGLFNVKYSITANSATQNESRIVLVMPAWLLFIMLILLTFLIVWVTLKIKKRRKLRSKMQL